MNSDDEFLSNQTLNSNEASTFLAARKCLVKRLLDFFVRYFFFRGHCFLTCCPA